MPLEIGAERGFARASGRSPFLLAWPVMLMVVAILVNVQTSALLVNYQSANLGLLPNGYNAAASNSAANQQLQQQQVQQQQQLQQQQQQQQQQDPNQYHPMDLTDSQQQQQQQQVQDQYAQQNSMAQYQSGANHLLQQYSARNNNNLQQQQQATGGISERETGPIFRFHGSALNGSIVKLFWSLESGYAADTFEIKYGPLKNHEMFSLALNGSAREATISSLQPDTDHQFTLYGFSGENGGQFWRPRFLKIKTPRLTDQPSSMPRPPPEDDQLMPLGVKAEAKSHQSIQLSWTEQERPASVSKHNSKRVNQIRYHVAEDPSSSQLQQQQQAKPGEAANGQTDSQNSTTTTNGQKASIKYNYLDVNEIQNRDNRVAIHKLKPGTEYVFAVKTLYVSANDPKKIHRHSSFSMETSARTFDLEPSPPRNFTIQPMQLTQDDINMGSTVPKLRLSWAPPESPNGQLRGYVILFAHEPNLPEDKWMKIMVNDSSADEWSIGRVAPGRSYYFKMRSVNQRGQGPDTETRLFIAPSPPLHAPSDRLPAPIPPNNLLFIIVLCLIAILFVLFLVVSTLLWRCRSNSRSSKARRKGSLQLDKTPNNDNSKLNNAFAQANSNNSQCSSTVAGRVTGTLARRSRQNDLSNNNNSKPDFWISAMDQQQAMAAAAAAASANNSEIKSNISEKSGSDINMAAMVSIQRDSPQQFTTQTTQLTPMLPEYRFASTDQQLMQQIQQQQQQQQQQSHYHTGHHHHQFGGALGFDQMDNATASALMTLSKRQQQQLQKYQIQFASTAGTTGGAHSNQAPSPQQQPPPPPPLNIEQQQQQQQQPLYGTHHQSGAHLNSTRSLRLHRPTLYDPVSGSFVQQDTPPNYNSHLNSMLNGVHHQLQSFNNQTNNSNPVTSGSNTLQFHHHPHQTSTLMSRRSTNTLRSFQSSGGGGGLYGQLGGQFAAPPVPPPTSGSGGPPHLLQNHQAVINQLNQASYPSLPLKHVSTVRPQIMSSLEDQIEMELAEKQAEQQHLQSQQQQQHQPGPPPSMQQQQQQDQPT